MNWMTGGRKPAGLATVLTGVLVAALSAFGAQPLSAQEATGKTDGPTRYAVGATGLTCANAPCPARGIWVAGSPRGSLAELKSALLFADQDGSVPMPRLYGAAADRQAVRDAWSSDDCIVVEGSFGPDDTTGIPRLRIERIVGPC